MSERSKNYELIKGYYETGKWSIDRVRNVVGKKNGITVEEFELITEQPYYN